MTDYVGTSGADTLPNPAGNDSISGLEGNDALNTGLLPPVPGNDTLDGGVGDDTVNGGLGADLLLGGDDNDVLVTWGGSGVDTLQGDAGADTLHAMNISTPAGPFFGNFAGSVFDGGDGVDYLGVDGHVDFQGSLSSIEGVYLAPAFSNGAVTIAPAVLEIGSAVIAALGPNATFRGTGQVILDTSGTFDGSGYVFEAGSNVAISIHGTDAGGDTLTGASNGDVIAGGASDGDEDNDEDLGADSLSGGGGNDTIFGEGGNDTLSGGAGDDIFVLSGRGQKIITDFTVGHDKFEMGGFDSFASLKPYLFEDANHNAVFGITYDGVLQTHTFQGVTLASLSAGDFIYENDPSNNHSDTGADNADVMRGGAGNDTEDGLGGADTVLGFAGNDSLLGGAGDDSVAGAAGNDTLTGDAGNDTLAGGGGNDLLDGGADADRLNTLGSQGADTLNGGDGDDTLTAINLTVLNAATHATVATLVGTFAGSTFNGGAGHDTLSVGGHVQFLGALSGIEEINLLAGGDTPSPDGTTISHIDPAVLDIGSGFEPNIAGPLTVSGTGLIRYTISDGDIDKDFIGPEEVVFAPGSNIDLEVYGSIGDDTIVGTPNGEAIFGGAGADQVVARGGLGKVSTVTLGAGADTLVLDPVLAGTVTVTDFQTGAGGDALSIAGFLSAHGVVGDPFAGGYLRLVEGGGATTLEFDANGGGDSFAPLVTLQNTGALALTAANLGGYAPAVSGGTGVDAFVYTPPAVFVGVQAGQTAPALDGGAGVDTLTITAPPPAPGGSGQATITPSADGTSLLFDLNGDGIADLTVKNVEDIVLNGEQVVISGNLVNTGLAPNTIVYHGSAGNNLLDAGGLTSLESIRAYGEGGNDTLIGANDDDTLDGGEGDDVLTARGGPDSLDGGAGNDTLDAGDGDDTLSGGAGDDKMLGGSGLDTLRGGDGADTLDGGNGKDNLEGGTGDDILWGGAGNDTLSGGGGSDRFEIEKGGGTDRVLDFGAGDHLVFVGGAGPVSWTVKDIDGDGAKDDLLVSASGSGGLSVELINVSTLHTGDWLFA